MSEVPRNIGIHSPLATHRILRLQERDLMNWHCLFVLPFACLEADMRLLFGIVATAIVPVWLGVHVNSAAAQDFDDRWSIIPKAHAEPAPEAIEQNPLERPPTGRESTRRSKDRSASQHSSHQ